jgi:hypothetical protein
VRNCSPVAGGIRLYSTEPFSKSDTALPELNNTQYSIIFKLLLRSPCLAFPGFSSQKSYTFCIVAHNTFSLTAAENKLFNKTVYYFAPEGIPTLA